MKHVNWMMHKKELTGARLFASVAVLAVLVLMARSMPDLIRYLRVRRM